EAVPHNLPRLLTSFVGREREIADVKRQLGRARLLTLTGPGGTGKTRLSLQVATDLLADFPDGVWLVELAPIADPALAPQALAMVLGVREETGRALIATLADHLRSRRALLLFDNCEHLIDACARLVDDLLRACSEVRIVASSREPLGLTGEVVHRAARGIRGDPALRRPRRGGQAGFRIDRRDRRSGGADQSATRRDSARNRAGRCPCPDLGRRPDRGASGRALPSLDRRQPRRIAEAPDAAWPHRLELRSSDRHGARAAPA